MAVARLGNKACPRGNACKERRFVSTSYLNTERCAAAAVVEDADVTAERRRVLESTAAGGRRDIISITNLRKQYDNSSRKVSQALRPHSCTSLHG